MKNDDLKNKSEAELTAEVARLKKELFDLQFKHSTRQLADTGALRQNRKAIARALTFKNQKARSAQ
jgi:large subunit ribosomal protein L29